MASEELKLLGKLDGKMDLVLDKLERIEERVEKHDQTLTKHSTYFKIIGGGISVFLTIAGIAAIIFF